MADYEKQTWVDNETLVDASRLSHMEEGIAQALPKSGHTANKMLRTNASGEVVCADLPTSVTMTDIKDDDEIVSVKIGVGSHEAHVPVVSAITKDIGVVRTMASLAKTTAEEAKTTAAAAANEAAATVGMYSDGYYQGVDLTVKFADEIANYSDPWAWIKARIKAGNYKQINIRDYIPFTTTNNRTFAAQAGGINTYKGYGDTEVGNHIDFITRELWPDTFQMNLIKFNNGVSGDAAIPWLASNGYLYLNSLAGKVPNSTTLPLEMADVDYTAGGVYYYLPTALKDVIVEKRVYAQIRYSASGVLTNDNSGAWVNLGKLWLPDEYEITGARMLSSRGWFSGGLVQYPIFSNSMDRAKSINGNRANWWTSSARADDSGSYVHVGYDGLVLGSAATIKYGVPICFRIA